MTTLFACSSDDSDDTGAGTAATEDPSATVTDPSATVTDPSSGTDPSATVTDTDTDPSATVTDTDATVTDTDPSTGTDPGTTTDPTGVDSSGTETGGPSAECELYCSTFIATCQDAEGGLDGADPYVDEADCLDVCAGFVVDDGTAMGGNDLECRGYHLMNAIAMPDQGHCGHADADGTGVCV